MASTRWSRMLGVGFAVAAGMLLTLVLAGGMHAQAPADLDPSFDGDGVAITHIEGADEGAGGVAGLVQDRGQGGDLCREVKAAVVADPVLVGVKTGQAVGVRGN